MIRLEEKLLVNILYRPASELLKGIDINYINFEKLITLTSGHLMLPALYFNIQKKKASYLFPEDFIGTLTVEATLDTTVTDSSWFTVYTLNGDGSSANDSTARFWNEAQNIAGRYSWMRVTISNFTQGTIHKVILSY